MLTRLTIVAAVVAAVLATTGMAASATAPSRQGWWTTGTAMAAGPDVPADGLLVQGGASADSPSALAALSFPLPSDMVAGKLTLKIAGGTATVPNSIVRVCKIAGNFAPAQGGAMADAPRYDCTDAVTGTIEGDHVTLDVSHLASSFGLDVALLPSAPTDRLVFAKPDAGALETHTSGVGAQSVDASTPTGFDSATVPSDQPLALPDVDPVVMPATPPASTSPTPASPTPQVASAASAGVATPGSSGSSAALIGLGVLAVALTAGLWLGAGIAASRRTELQEAGAGPD